MENYSFWQDFFATYRSSSDAIKALWLVVPPTFAVALARVALKPWIWKCHERNISNITVEPVTGESSVPNGKNEEVLIFVRGRLLDRLETPAKFDGEGH